MTRARAVVLGAALACALVATRAAAAPAPGDRETRAAIQRVLDASKRGVEAELRLALLDLPRHDDPEAVELVLRMLEHQDAAWRPTLRRVLGSFAGADSLAHVASEGLRSGEEVVRTQCLIALGDARPEGLDWIPLAEAALDDPFPQVRAAAVEALGKVRAQGRLDRILALTTDGSERVRRVVPEALARLAGERSLAALSTLADDPRWRVRLGVVRAAFLVKTRAAVELLVDMLDGETGRVREDLLAALRRLTGRNLGLSADAWRTYLGMAPDDFLERADAYALEPAPPPTSAVRYHGLSTLSSDFVFVTDVSTSMDTVDTRRYRDDERGKSRLRFTQDELERLLGSLDGDHAFNLVTFSDGVRTWQKKLVRGEPGMLKRAVNEVAGYRASGGTNVHAALLAVFDMAAASVDAQGSADDPDTVFFLSDGAPSSGAVRDPQLLLDLADERNRELDLRFHCVVLTNDPVGREFMTGLAAHSGGQVVSPLD